MAKDTDGPSRFVRALALLFSLTVAAVLLGAGWAVHQHGPAWTADKIGQIVTDTPTAERTTPDAP